MTRQMIAIALVLSLAPVASAQIRTAFQPVSGDSANRGNPTPAPAEASRVPTTPAVAESNRPADDITPITNTSNNNGGSLVPVNPGTNSGISGESAGGGIARVTKGSGVLPNDHGQVWREYDISPYTSRVTTTAKPEQAIVDWILRETGAELWFAEPLGILSANRNSLKVYHTPEIQSIVAKIVDRFVSSEAESHAFGVHLVTVGSPNWRAKGFGMMQPVPVQSPGLEAWLLSKENAALLLAELRKRTDFRDHSSPNLMIHNGQSHTIASIRPRNFVKSVVPKPNAFPGYEMEMGQVDEGYSLQLSPLLSLERDTVDAVIKCQVDQVEKLVPITIGVPSLAAQPTNIQIQIPQMSSWSLHERFRWPTDKVLVLSRGVVAAPAPAKPNMLGIPNPFEGEAGRADALLFISSAGKESQTLQSTRTAQGGNLNYRGRY